MTEAVRVRAWWSGRFFKPESLREGLKGSDAQRKDRRKTRNK